MLTRAARRRWWALVVFTGAVLSFAALSGGDPDSASGGVLDGAKDALGGLIGGGVSKVAGAVGGGVMKEVLEYLFGDLKAIISLEMVKWLTEIDLNIGPSLAKLAGPMVVIGGFFLVVGLITSVGDSYREVVAGTDTAARVIGQAIFRVIGLALLMGSWFWLVPLAVEVANGMSAYVLDDAATQAALAKAFRAQTIMSLNPLFALVVALLLVFSTLALVVMKFVIVIMFAALYLGGVVLIGFAALPRVGNAPLSMALRGLLTLMVIPLAWVVVFAAWAGISAGITENVNGADDAVRVLTGPALFLAGMVVLLGITKKLLSMASFGMPLSVPGGRMLRMAASMAMIKGIGAAAGGGAGAGAGAKGGGVPNPANMPTKGGTGGSSGGGASPIASPAPAGVGQPQGGRPQLKPVEGSAKEQLAQQRANDKNLENRLQGEAARTRIRTRDGEFSGPDASPEAFAASVARGKQVRAAHGGAIPDQAVGQALTELGPANATAAAGAARGARRDYPQDPGAAQAVFGDTIHAKTGGQRFSSDDALNARHEANWAVVSAASPEQVEGFAGGLRDRHDWNLPGSGQPGYRGGGGDFQTFQSSEGPYLTELFPQDRPAPSGSERP